MNKTISINISGLVFNIEEEAYEILKAYLDSIKQYFSTQEGGGEIVGDIEARIAELFQEVVNEEKNAITLNDVNSVISSLGQPQDMMDEEDAEDNRREEATGEQQQQQQWESKEKRLFRDPDNRLLGGVCSGLGAYFGVDPVWLRLALVLGVLLYGTGIWLYVILWIVIPEAKTTSDRLKMKGKPINVDNIEKSIKKGAKDFEEGISEFINDPKKKERINRGANDARSGFVKVVDAITQVVVLFAKFILKFATVIFAVVGVAVIFGVSMALITGLIYHDYGALILPNGFHSTILLLALALIVVVPVALLLIRIFKSGFRESKIHKSVNITAFVIWILAVLTVFGEAINVLSEFKMEATVEKNVVMERPDAERIYIRTDSRRNSSRTLRMANGTITFSNEDIYLSGDSLYYKDVNFDTERSLDSSFHLKLRYWSRGGNYNEAVENAELINYVFLQDDSTIILSPFMNISTGPYRGQNVTVVLQIPEGKEIMFLNNTYDIDNYAPVRSEYGFNYANRVFEMGPSGLKYVPSEEQYAAQGGMMTYDYGSFDEVDIQSERKLRVEIVEGTAYRVLVDGQMNDRRGFRLSKRHGHQLRIELNDLWTSDLPDVPVHVRVECPDLSEVECVGQAECFISTNNADRLKLEFAGATSAHFNGNAHTLNVEVAGVADLTMKGTARYAHFEVVGSSNLKAEELYIERANVELSGSSDATVNVSDHLDARVSGVSELRYIGQPTISQRVSGVSKITSINPVDPVKSVDPVNPADSL